MSGWADGAGGSETVTLTCLMATKHFQSQTSSPSGVGRHSSTLPSNVRRSPAVPILFFLSQTFLTPSPA